MRMTPAPVPGGRYIHQIRAGYASALGSLVDEPTRKRWLLTHPDDAYSIASALDVLETLDDPEFRRIVVDSQQAVRFTEVDGLPPLDEFRLPFEKMYIEFTEPIKVSDDEVADVDDWLMAIQIDGEKIAGLAGDYGEIVAAGDMVSVRFLLDNRADGYSEINWADRTFIYDRRHGWAISRLETYTEGPDPTVFSAETMWEMRRATYDLKGHEGRNVADGHWIRAGAPEGREHYGWWERTIESHAAFVSWLLTYMTAKGIVIVEEQQPSRQARRALERMKHRPPPWHIVMVDPTIVRDDEERGADSRGPSYRHDVRGHFRFRTHPRFKNRVEWVRSHQRGLANAVYIPKTYVYDDKSPQIEEFV